MSLPISNDDDDYITFIIVVTVVTIAVITVCTTYLSVSIGGWVACRGEDVEEDERVTLMVEGRACTEDPRQAVYAEVAVRVPRVDVIAHLSSPCCCSGCQREKGRVC